MTSPICINGRTIHAKQARCELAWPMDDAPSLLAHLAAQGRIIHGGDILDDALEYTCCNWYYQKALALSRSDNIRRSLDTALGYLQRFTQRNGTNFYVVIVAESIPKKESPL